MPETPRFLYHGTTLDGFNGIRNHSLGIRSIRDIAKYQRELCCYGDGAITASISYALDRAITASISYALDRAKHASRIHMPVLVVIDAAKHREQTRFTDHYFVRQPLEKDGFVGIDLELGENGRMNEQQSMLLINLDTDARELSDFLRASSYR